MHTEREVYCRGMNKTSSNLSHKWSNGHFKKNRYSQTTITTFTGKTLHHLPRRQTRIILELAQPLNAQIKNSEIVHMSILNSRRRPLNFELQISSSARAIKCKKSVKLLNGCYTALIDYLNIQRLL